VTIALAINVGDSLVLASDSATTQRAVLPSGQTSTINVWNSANKIFNLRKAWAIGAMTWGQAEIGGRSIATLAKDLRSRLSGQSEDHADWTLDPSSITLSDVADRARSFFYDEHFSKKPEGTLGLLIGGYSANQQAAEWYIVEMDKTACHGPNEALPAGAAGLVWRGQPEAIARLASGLSLDLGRALQNLQVPANQVDAYVDAIKRQVERPMAWAGMPIGEVIDLAEFLVDATIKFVRFTPGDASVGGPIEIAALTKHEGFKWIKRKHHFSTDLNPSGG